MTITEKIIAYHAGKNQVKPGELVNVKVDLVLGNDITAPLAIEELKKAGINKVFDKEKIALVPDHFVPNKDVKSAAQCKMVRDFVKIQGITNYFEVGRMGIEHALIPEKGLVLPGDLVIGADSHTCTYGALGAFASGVGSTDMAAAMALGETWLKIPETIKFNVDGQLKKWVRGKDIILYIIGQIGVDGALYKAMEFGGSAVSSLSMDSRFSVCNMAIEAGAKNGIIEPDEVTETYVKERASKTYEVCRSDKDANYQEVVNFKAEDIELQVALPPLPSNAVPVKEASGIKVDQVVIGSCTNGRLEDLRMAAQILKGNKVNPGVRCIIIPATQAIYRQAIEEGLFEIFLDSQAAISTPTCGPCLGGYMGVLAEGERAVATTNRNFVGRMGHPKSEVYLAGPAVAAASAVTGKISLPEEIV